MTIDERARKILGIVGNPDTISNDQFEMAVAELRSVREEGFIDAQLQADDMYQVDIKQARSEAYADAARIAEDRATTRREFRQFCCEATAHFIGVDIRARAEEKL